MSAKDYKHWYSQPAWKRKSKAQLMAEPLCRDCLSRGIVTPAREADHIEPHRGDKQAFWTGELQSLCKECHSVKTAREQGKITRKSVAIDGAPEDW